MLPVTGLPEFRPGDDLGAALAAAAPWLRDGDVAGGHQQGGIQVRGPASFDAPVDPQARDDLRRKLVDTEAVRVLARKGSTLITENALGVVQAAAGVDGSNVDAGEFALLPVDPDASAAALRAGLRERLGVTVGVSSPTPWVGHGVTVRPMLAIGAAGLVCCTPTRARMTAHGNEFIVTEVAIADEIAAAADLVKGKLTGHTGGRGARTAAGCRGCDRRRATSG